MVRISLDVQQDTIERLESLSDFYDKDITEIINEIIEVISHRSGWVLKISKRARRFSCSRPESTAEVCAESDS